MAGDINLVTLHCMDPPRKQTLTMHMCMSSAAVLSVSAWPRRNCGHCRVISLCQRAAERALHGKGYLFLHFDFAGRDGGGAR